MRWLISLVARFYPRSWRAEFGEEFDAFLEDVRPRWRVVANVLGGAVAMQITDGTGWLKVVGVMAVVGAVVGGGASFRVPATYVSSAVISVTPQVDPVRPVSPEVLRERAAEHVGLMETQILSRTDLSAIMQDPRIQLYKDELRRMPLEDVIEKMRRNIRIQARPSTDGGPIVFSISFSYPDQVKARTVVRALENKFAVEIAVTNRTNADAYVGFWGDMSATQHTKPAPPPPVGETVLLKAASAPVESGPNRIAFLAWGLGSGLLLGLLAALALRWPRGSRRLGGFALAGCFLAGAASFLIPNRYTSTAWMEISPAQVTEDPLAPLPGVTPAAELLRQMEPEVLSVQNLSRMIEDPRNNLYAAERAKKPVEEIVRNMLTNDLRIAPLNPASAANGTVSAFSISFSYSDRYKAQQTVQALMNAFDELYHEKAKAKADASGDMTLHAITQRKAGEVLDVLDTASIPVRPVSPNRVVIAGFGFGIGLLVGAVVMWFQRPGGMSLEIQQFGGIETV